MKFVEGDLFLALEGLNPLDKVIVPHVCNSHGVMGSGFVVPLAKHYPQVKAAYLEWSQHEEHSEVWDESDKFALGETQIVVAKEKPEILFANMVAQILGGERPLHYNHLSKCMDYVAYAAKYNKSRIIAPLFGAGLAGGDWKIIEKLIEDCWLRPGLDVTIHYIKTNMPPGWTPPA